MDEILADSSTMCEHEICTRRAVLVFYCSRCRDLSCISLIRYEMSSDSNMVWLL